MTPSLRASRGDVPRRRAFRTPAHKYQLPAPTTRWCAGTRCAGTAEASARWLQFSDWYVWPHFEYFDTPEEAVQLAGLLLRNATRRHEVSRRMKAFFASETERTRPILGKALKDALRAAAEARAAARG